MTVDLKKKYIIEAYDMTINGDGIARLPESDESGKLAFCPNLLPGEIAQVSIDAERKNYVHVSILQYIKKSDIRKFVKCEGFGSCGGCALLHISYEKQLELKKKHVADCLIRIGKFDEADISSLVRPVLGMENPYFYRNHVQYQVENIDDKCCLGFYEKKTNKLIVHERCFLVPEICHKIRITFPVFIAENKILCQNMKTRQNSIKRLTVRVGFHTGDVMLIIEGGENLHFSAEEYVKFVQQVIREDKKLFAENWKIKSIWKKQDGKKTEYKHLWGEKYIEEVMGEKIYMISPSSFFQVNSQQTLVLYNQIKSFVEQSMQESWNGKLIDLYCGTGTIGLHLSDIVPRILGIEINAEAISDAWQNACRNDIENCEYIQGKAENVSFQIDSDDIVILDPPRKGCDKRLLELLSKSMSGSIVYISCDPATLARDLRILADGGFGIKAIQPVDMFPWTGHVECVVLMSRKDG